MGYGAGDRVFFLIKGSVLERVYQAGFMKKDKKIIVEGRGVSNKDTEGKGKIAF